MFSAEVAHAGALQRLVERLQQDAIAIWYPDRSTGVLFGPRSDEWEPFDEARFILPEVF